MRTLIVLCAGQQMRMQRPLYLNCHPDGKVLAIKALENIYKGSYDRIIYTVSQEDCEKYSTKDILVGQGIFPDDICVLNERTSGPAESAYRTIERMNVIGEIAIRDCTSAFGLDGDAHGNFVAGLDLSKYEQEIYHVHTKSFIVTNEQDQILDIVEKSFRSDIISVGLYGFRYAEDFVMAYEHLSDKHHPVDHLYVSNIISYLIGYEGLIFNYVGVTGYEDWRDSNEWTKLREQYGHIKLVMVDLDGTLFDTRKVNFMAYQEALSHHGFDMDYQYFCDYCNGKHYIDFLPQLTTGDEQIVCKIHAEKKAAYKKYLRYAVVNQTLIDILRLLSKEYRRALVTTASRENTYDILNYFGLVEDFDLILTQDDIKNSKPDPEGFLKAMAYFNAKPTECIIFEDSKEGIEAAKRSGVQCYEVKEYR